jgi:hypothetical protein
MRAITLVILFLIANQLTAQVPVRDSVLLNIRSIKFSVADIFDSYLFSYEHQMGRNFSLMAEAGPSRGRHQDFNSIDKTKGYKLRGELRYLGAIKNHARLYLGVQYMHKQLSGEDFKDEFAVYGNQYRNFFEYDYLKKIDALNLTFGMLKGTKESLLFDFGFFVGIKRKQVFYSDVPKGFSPYHEDEPDLFTILEESYDETPFNAGVTLRIGIGAKNGLGFLIGPYEK